jgi:hypothetical protein
MDKKQHKGNKLPKIKLRSRNFINSTLEHEASVFSNKDGDLVFSAPTLGVNCVIYSDGTQLTRPRDVTDFLVLTSRTPDGFLVLQHKATFGMKAVDLSEVENSHLQDKLNDSFPDIAAEVKKRFSELRELVLMH